MHEDDRARLRVADRHGNAQHPVVADVGANIAPFGELGGGQWGDRFDELRILLDWNAELALVERQHPSHESQHALVLDGDLLLHELDDKLRGIHRLVRIQRVFVCHPFGEIAHLRLRVRQVRIDGLERAAVLNNRDQNADHRHRYRGDEQNNCGDARADRAPVQRLAQARAHGGWLGGARGLHCFSVRCEDERKMSRRRELSQLPRRGCG